MAWRIGSGGVLERVRGKGCVGAERWVRWRSRERGEELIHRDREEAIPLPDYCQADIMKSTELLDDVTVTSAGSSLIIGGGSASVQETILKTKDMISDFEVSTEEKTYPRKHINYLKKFCKHVLDSIPDYTLDPDLKVIVVSGNKKVRECFWSKVQSEISNIQEKIYGMNTGLANCNQSASYNLGIGIQIVEDLRQ